MYVYATVKILSQVLEVEVDMKLNFDQMNFLKISGNGYLWKVSKWSCSAHSLGAYWSSEKQIKCRIVLLT